MISLMVVLIVFAGLTVLYTTTADRRGASVAFTRVCWVPLVALCSRSRPAASFGSNCDHSARLVHHRILCPCGARYRSSPHGQAGGQFIPSPSARYLDLVATIAPTGGPVAATEPRSLSDKDLLETCIDKAYAPRGLEVTLQVPPL